MPMPLQVTSQTLDHLGIVAGLCQDLRIADRVNALLNSRTQAAKVTAGDAVVAMIISGMGFTKRTLYLTPRFLQGKPVAKIFGKDLRAEDFNDDTLGRALDAISDFGPEKLFGSQRFPASTCHRESRVVRSTAALNFWHPKLTYASFVSVSKSAVTFC